MAASNGTLLLPDARFRSPTAVDGKSDLRDENVYSALVVQDTGSGQQSVFTVPKGQSIPALAGTSSATTNAHQTKYTDLTTNLTKAGELGSGLGDASIRAIGLTIEQAAITPATGAPRSFGATQYEVADILAKCFFQLKVGGKTQVTGPVFAFPSSGAAMGSVSTTGNAATASIANNGMPGTMRRLKVPVLVARNDTIEGIFGVAGGASLSFNPAKGADGQPTLVWFNLYSLIKGDVR